MSSSLLSVSSHASLPPGRGTSPTGIVMRRRARTRAPVPPRLTVILLVTFLALAVQVGAAVFLTTGGVAGLAVRVEEGTAPVLAAGMLLAGAVFAVAGMWTVAGDTMRAWVLWTVLAGVAAFFAAGELTPSHARIRRVLLDVAGSHLPQRLRRGDDLRVACYALGLGLFALLLHREAARYRWLRPLLGAAAVSAAGGRVLADVARTPTVLTTLAGRLLHDAAAVLLALGLLAGLVAAGTLRRDRAGLPLPARRLRVGPGALLLVGLVTLPVPAFATAMYPSVTVPGLPPVGGWPAVAVAGTALFGAVLALLGAVLAARGYTERDATRGRTERDRDPAGDRAEPGDRHQAEPQDQYSDFWASR